MRIPEFADMLSDGLLVVLPWVAAGAVAAAGLMFVVLGIRAGLSFFMAIVEERRAGGDFMGSGMSEAALTDYWTTGRGAQGAILLGQYDADNDLRGGDMTDRDWWQARTAHHMRQGKDLQAAMAATDEDYGMLREVRGF